MDPSEGRIRWGVSGERREAYNGVASGNKPCKASVRFVLGNSPPVGALDKESPLKAANCRRAGLT